MAQQGQIRSRATVERLPAIPDKLYFRIGEVAHLCDVPAYVLRFWESEFPQLKPNKGGTGQRLYRRRDVETALRIKSLLYDEGFTITGARQALKSEKQIKEPQMSLSIVPEAPAAAGGNSKALRKLQQEMRDLLALLEGAPGTKAERPARAPKAGRQVAAKAPDLFT